MLALLAYFADECALAKCTGDRQNSLEGVWTTGRATEAVQWSTFGVMGGSSCLEFGVQPTADHGHGLEGCRELWVRKFWRGDTALPRALLVRQLAIGSNGAKIRREGEKGRDF